MNQRKKQRGRPRGRSAPSGGAARGARLEELIREEINFVLSSEVSDPRLDGVVVTQVELALDGSRARLWFTQRTAEPERDHELESALARASGFLRARLCDLMFLKRVPELRFRRDLAVREWSGGDEKSL